LVDTGADLYTAIDPSVSTEIIKKLNLIRVPLGRSIPVTDYHGRPGTPITSALVSNLWVDGRMEYSAPILETPLGPSQQMILGRIWLAIHGVLPDARHRRLVWPPERSRDTHHRVIEIPYEKLRAQPVDPAHQQDMQRRDGAIEKQDRRQQEQRTLSLLKRKKPDPPTLDLPRTEQLPCTEPAGPCDPLHPGRGGHKGAQKATSTDHHYKHEQKMAKALREPYSADPPKERTVAEGLQWEWSQYEDTKGLETAARAVMISAVAMSTMLKRNPGHQHSFVSVGISSINSIQKVIDHKKRLLEGEDEDTQRAMEAAASKHPYLEEYADVFSKKESDNLPPHREADHKIEVESKQGLTTSPLYGHTLTQLEALKAYLKDCLERGFIEPSSAPFASPVLFALKSDGSWRVCVDYRKLNALTTKNRYPLPLIDDTLRQLGKAKIFTKLDIRQAFHRIRMDPESEDLTTFRTRYGQYKYKVMPFGLCNGPATFQSFINSQVFEFLDHFLTAYIDDLIIYSDNEEEHQEHVKKVLQKLRGAGLQADLKKCEFHTTETKFLGFIVGTDGIRVDPQKIEAVTSWQTPATVKGVQAFLGFCNFYRRFVERYGNIARPLQKLTMKDRAFQWTDDCQEAFDHLKKALTTTPLLVHYQIERETRLETDASDGVIAGVLSQKVDELWRPVCYFSKTMNGPEGNYPIHDKELLAIVRACEEWYPLLLGIQKKFEVLTDHHALQYFMTKRLLNARQAGWSEFLAPLNFEIKYRPGKMNAAADGLSRKTEDLTTQKAIQAAYRTQTLLPAHKLDPQVLKEFQEISEQEQDLLNTQEPPISVQACKIWSIDTDDVEGRPQGVDLIDKILQANRGAESLESFREMASKPGNDTDWTIQEGLLLKGGRLVVAGEDNLRTHLLAEIHEQLPTAHPGRNKMRTLVRQRYYWPKMFSDIDTFVRNCLTCRRSHKPRDKTPGLLKPLDIPNRPWQHVTMDFHSMPEDKQGYDQVFVVVDRLTKRAYSLPCYKTTTAKEMAGMYYKYVWRNHGVPDSVVSDRGPQFISHFWDEFCRMLGVKIKLSSSEHPQTDGQTEIMNQYLDQRLRPFVNHYQDNWAELLPAMDFAQAILPHESIGLSPFEVETGYQPRMSFDWEARSQQSLSEAETLSREDAVKMTSRIQEAVLLAKEHLEKAQATQKKQADKHRRPEDFKTGDYVMVTKGNWQTNRPSDKLDFPVSGPFKILAKKGASYLLDLPDTWKMHPVFSPDKLRKAPSDPLPGQVPTPLPPEEIDGELEYQVEKLMGSRLTRGKLEYLAKWIAFDDDPVWYPARNFKNAPAVVRKFHEEFPEAAGPPKRLTQWEKAHLEELDEEDHPEDDFPESQAKEGPTRSRRRYKS
jgi:transposase InsO family protein